MLGSVSWLASPEKQAPLLSSALNTLVIWLCGFLFGGVGGVKVS